MELKALLAAADQLTHDVAMRIAAAVDPRTWDPAHAAMQAVTARLAMVERWEPVGDRAV